MSYPYPDPIPPHPAPFLPLSLPQAGDAPIMLVHSSQKILRQKIGEAASARFAH